MHIVEPIREIQKIEQVKALLLENRERDFVLFELGINTGLRISDILKLKVSDVRNKKYIKVVEKKTKKSRMIIITPKMENILQNYTKDKDLTEYLFPSRKGGNPITRVQAYRILNSVCRLLEIQHIGTHSLRKTFGYHLYNKTKDVVLIQSILNHSSPKITLRYIGVTQDIIDKNMMSFSL